MKNREFLFIILLIVFCTERLEKVFTIGLFDLYPCRFLFVVLLIGFPLSQFQKKASREVKSIFKVYLLFIFVVLVSALKSPDILFSFKKWLDIVTVNSFIFLTYGFMLQAGERTNIDRLYNLFLRYFKVILLIIAVCGVFLYRYINNGELEERSILGIAFYRRISLFNDPNFYSTFLIVAFFLLYFSKIKYRIHLLVIIIISVFLTGSKGGIIAMLITLFLYYRRRIPIARTNVFIIIVVGLALGCLAIILFNPFLAFDTLNNLPIFSSKSGADTGSETALPRLLAWSGGMKEFMKEPILGLGPGNIVNINKGKSIGPLLDYVQNAGFYGLDDDKIDKLATHSTYLETLFETGIIAFSCYIIFLYRILRYLLRASVASPKYFLGYTLGFISFYLSIFFLSYNPYFINFMTGLFLYFIDRHWREQAKIHAINIHNVNVVPKKKMA
jgi:O-antigen ligase